MDDTTLAHLDQGRVLPWRRLGSGGRIMTKRNLIIILAAFAVIVVLLTALASCGGS